MAELYQIRIMPEASEDLHKIRDGIEPGSPQNAFAVTVQLLGAIESLDYYPYRFRVHLFGRKNVREIRSMVVSPYIVFYEIIEREKVIKILTVRHGAQRPLPPSHFN